MSKRKISTTAHAAPEAPQATAPTDPPAPWHFLTLAQWRQSPARVEWLAGLMRDVTFREFMGMLHNEARSRGVVQADAIAVAVEFGRSEGRLDVLNMMETASTLWRENRTEIPVNYGITTPEEAEEGLA